MEDLISKLNQHKLNCSKQDLHFFIDMGYEFYIFKGNDEEPEEMLYEGNIFSFISELMEHFNVKDDSYEDGKF
jgi:hypothetical protein